MLEKLDITNRRGMTLSLEMVENDGQIQIADIDGLEPVKATLVSSSFAGQDYEEFQSARRGARNIKLKFQLDPDFVNDTFSSLRTGLYTYFMPKSQVTLRFWMSTGLFVDIVGIVEDFTSPRFDADPDVTISIMCFKSDFIDPRRVTLEGGSVNDDTIIEINYPGSVETGVVIVMNVVENVGAFTIYNETEDGTLYQLDFSAALETGDQLVISSLKGAKGITLTRAGVSQSYLYGKTAQSSWIELREGVNNFRVYAPGSPIQYEMQYDVRYGGL